MPEPPPHSTVRDDKADRDNEPVYVISVAAKLAGLPLWTLRVLDREGIVVPQRTAQGRRLYSDWDTARLARVRYLTEERGVNMAGVRVILELDIEMENPVKGHEETARSGQGDNP